MLEKLLLNNIMVLVNIIKKKLIFLTLVLINIKLKINLSIGKYYIVKSLYS
jgi:hypothetical protein